MANVNLHNLARMTVSSTGTGTITLNAAVSGFLTFDLSGCSTAAAGSLVRYAIADTTKSEIGFGTYTSSSLTLTRGSSTTGLKSTNSNSPIDMSNAAQVFITDSAADHVVVADSAGTAASMSLNMTFSGTATFQSAITYGGVTLSNAVTGTGNMVLSASPTLTGTTTIATLALTTVGAHTISGAITYGGVTLSNAVTGTGNMVLSASPTFTGSITAAAISMSGALGAGSVTASGLVSGGTVGGSMVATQAEMETASATDKLVSPGRVRFSPASAKAWLQYNGTTNTIVSSFNVSSVTDGGTGTYTVNFTNAMSTANYCVICTQISNTWFIEITGLATTSFTVSVFNDSHIAQDANITLVVFGDQ